MNWKLIGLLGITWLANGQGISTSYFGMHVSGQVNNGNHAGPTLTYGPTRSLSWGGSSWNNIITGGTCGATFPGDYNLVNITNGINHAISVGASPIWLSLGYTPGCANGNPGTNCLQSSSKCYPPTDVNSDGTGTDAFYSNFITNMAAWLYTTYPGTKFVFEGWNEWNDIVSWRGTNQQLVRMSKDAYNIIHGNTNYVKAGWLVAMPPIGGSGWATSTGITTAIPSYLQTKLADNQCAGHWADIATFHGYTYGVGVLHPYVGVQAAALAIKAILASPGNSCPALTIPLVNGEGNPWNTQDHLTDFTAQAAATSQWILAQIGPVQSFDWYESEDSGTFCDTGSAVWGILWIGSGCPSGNPAGLTKAGVAFRETQNWLTGSQPLNNPACNQVGSSTQWSCAIIRPNGSSSVIAWDTAGASTFTLPQIGLRSHDIIGNTSSLPATLSVLVNVAPIMVDLDPVVMSGPNTLVESTARQAKICYSTGQGGWGTWRVSRGLSFTANIPDITINGNSDNPAQRPAATFIPNLSGIGGSHCMIVGSPQTAWTLAADADYWYGLTVGSSPEVTGTFHTSTIRAGATAPDAQMFDSARPFNIAYPPLSWTDPTHPAAATTTEGWIDPTTGAEWTRVDGPAFGFPNTLAAYISPAPLTGIVPITLAGTPCTSLGNIGLNGTAYANCPGSTSKVFIPLLRSTGIPTGFQNINNSVLDDVDLSLYCGNAGLNQKITAALSVDSGQTTFTNTVTSGLCSSGADAFNGFLPQQYPLTPFAGWGVSVQPDHILISPTSGNVTLAAHTLTLAGGNHANFFSNKWTSGSKIFVPGSAAMTGTPCTNNYCTVQSVTNSTVLTIVENCTGACPTAVTYQMANFGIVLGFAQPTAVDVSVGYSYGTSSPPQWATNGSLPRFSQNPVPGGVSMAPCYAGLAMDENGVAQTCANAPRTFATNLTGYLMSDGFTFVGIWIPKNANGTARNEFRMLGVGQKRSNAPSFNSGGDYSGGGNVGVGFGGEGMFDLSDGLSYYSLFAHNFGDGYTAANLFKMTYSPANTVVTPNGSQSCAGYLPYWPGPNGFYIQGSFNDDCFTYTNLAPHAANHDVVAQLKSGYQTGVNYNGIAVRGTVSQVSDGSLVNIVVAGTTATAHFTGTHWQALGNSLTVAGSATAALNGTFNVSGVTNIATLTFTVSGVSAATYTDASITTFSRNSPAGNPLNTAWMIPTGGINVPFIAIGQAGGCLSFGQGEHTQGTAVFSLTTGALSYITDSFSGANNRWGGQHGDCQLPIGNYFNTVENIMQDGGGNVPFQNSFNMAINAVWRAGAWQTGAGTQLTTPNETAVCSSNMLPAYTSYAGTSNCMKYRFATPPANHSPSTYIFPSTNTEIQEFPCTIPGFGAATGASAWSCLQLPLPGDFFMYRGNNTGYARDVVQNVSYDTSGGFLIMEVFRFWTKNILGAVQAGCDDRTLNVDPAAANWSYYAAPSGSGAGCVGSSGSGTWFRDASKPLGGGYFANPVYSGAHSTAMTGPVSGYSWISAGYAVALNQTPDAIAQSLLSLNVNTQEYPLFNNIQGVGINGVEEYPSATQAAATDGITKAIVTQAHVRNPGFGSGASEQVGSVVGNAYTISLVAGTTRTYLITDGLSVSPNVKVLPYVFNANQLYDELSSPRMFGALADLPNRSGCRAFKANECVFGSVAGNLYVASSTLETALPHCYTSQVSREIPCASTPGSIDGMIDEALINGAGDYKGTQARTFGYASNIGSPYQFWNAFLDPTGQYLFSPRIWADGNRINYWVMRRPLWTQDSVDRTQFVPTTVQVAIPRNPRIAYMRGRFGYAQYRDNGQGYASSYHCTPYQADCSTDLVSGVPADPFSYVGLDTPVRVAAAPGGTATVILPLIAGRVANAVVDFLDSGGNVVGSQPMQPIVIP